jgi:hypothetical protein
VRRVVQRKQPRLWRLSANDGVLNEVDNCSEIYNPSQNDTDGDFLGNACDPDFNNDCTVDEVDEAMFSALQAYDPLYDLDGDGFITIADYNQLVICVTVYRWPGPSGYPDNLCALPEPDPLSSIVTSSLLLMGLASRRSRSSTVGIRQLAHPVRGGRKRRACERLRLPPPRGGG